MAKVYIALDRDTGEVKVGISKNPKQRASVHGDLMNIIDVDSPLVEKHLHEELAPWNTRGEWFGLPLEVFRRLTSMDKITLEEIAEDGVIQDQYRTIPPEP